MFDNNIHRNDGGRTYQSFLDIANAAEKKGGDVKGRAIRVVKHGDGLATTTSGIVFGSHVSQVNEACVAFLRAVEAEYGMAAKAAAYKKMLSQNGRSMIPLTARVIKSVSQSMARFESTKDSTAVVRQNISDIKATIKQVRDEYKANNPKLANITTEEYAGIERDLLKAIEEETCDGTKEGILNTVRDLARGVYEARNGAKRDSNADFDEAENELLKTININELVNEPEEPKERVEKGQDRVEEEPKDKVEEVPKNNVEQPFEEKVPAEPPKVEVAEVKPKQPDFDKAAKEAQKSIESELVLFIDDIYGSTKEPIKELTPKARERIGTEVRRAVATVSEDLELKDKDVAKEIVRIVKENYLKPLEDAIDAIDSEMNMETRKALCFALCESKAFSSADAAKKALSYDYESIERTDVEDAIGECNAGNVAKSLAELLFDILNIVVGDANDKAACVGDEAAATTFCDVMVRAYLVTHPEIKGAFDQLPKGTRDALANAMKAQADEKLAPLRGAGVSENGVVKGLRWRVVEPFLEFVRDGEPAK